LKVTTFFPKFKFFENVKVIAYETNWEGNSVGVKPNE
jgi:hypothetical protein